MISKYIFENKIGLTLFEALKFLMINFNLYSNPEFENVPKGGHNLITLIAFPRPFSVGAEGKRQQNKRLQRQEHPEFHAHSRPD